MKMICMGRMEVTLQSVMIGDCHLVQYWFHLPPRVLIHTTSRLLTPIILIRINLQLIMTFNIILNDSATITFLITFTRPSDPCSSCYFRSRQIGWILRRSSFRFGTITIALPSSLRGNLVSRSTPKIPSYLPLFPIQAANPDLRSNHKFPDSTQQPA